MSLEPLFEAPLVVQIHAFGAMAAAILGLVQFAAPKGTASHRTLGAVFMLLMAVVAGSTLWMTHPVGPDDPFWARYSPIHLFTLLTFFGLFSATIILVRGGPGLKRHAAPLGGVFIGGLIVAGVLAFLPGRIMHQVAFGG
ncbi:MAG: DUF2306 domain-containing protein [Parvularculaceae bacterium]|nr:DUF2306 domain-containing protein [Parvularculaceae bacterium]